MHASRFHAPQLPDIPTPKAGGQGGWARRVPQRRCWRRRSAPNSKIPECARPAIRTRDWRLKAGDPALRAAPRLGRLAPGIPPPAPHLIGRRHRPCSARHRSQSPYAAAPPSATAHPPPRRVSWSRAHARRVRRARLSLSAAPPPRRAAVTTCLRGSRRLWAVSGGSAARDAAAGARTGGDRVGRRRLRSCPPIEGGVWPVALREPSSRDRAVGETAAGGPAGVPPCVGGVGEARGAGTSVRCSGEWGAGGPGMRALRRI